MNTNSFQSTMNIQIDHVTSIVNEVLPELLTIEPVINPSSIYSETASTRLPRCKTGREYEASSPNVSRTNLLMRDEIENPQRKRSFPKNNSTSNKRFRSGIDSPNSFNDEINSTTNSSSSLSSINNETFNFINDDDEGEFSKNLVTPPSSWSSSNFIQPATSTDISPFCSRRNLPVNLTSDSPNSHIYHRSSSPLIFRSLPHPLFLQHDEHVIEDFTHDEEQSINTRHSKHIGATPEQINDFTVAYHYEKTSTSIEERCSICLNEYQHNDYVRRLLCLHFYHVECIDRWFTESKQCPVCRIDIDYRQEMLYKK